MRSGSYDKMRTGSLEPNQSSGDFEPNRLLETLNQTCSTATLNRTSSPHATILPKVEIPLFEGVNPPRWVRRCNKYFLAHNTSYQQKVEVAYLFLKEIAGV